MIAFSDNRASHAEAMGWKKGDVLCAVRTRDLPPWQAVRLGEMSVYDDLDVAVADVVRVTKRDVVLRVWHSIGPHSSRPRGGETLRMSRVVARDSGWQTATFDLWRAMQGVDMVRASARLAREARSLGVKGPASPMWLCEKINDVVLIYNTMADPWVGAEHAVRAAMHEPHRECMERHCARALVMMLAAWFQPEIAEGDDDLRADGKPRRGHT